MASKRLQPAVLYIASLCSLNHEHFKKFLWLTVTSDTVVSTFSTLTAFFSQISEPWNCNWIQCSYFLVKYCYYIAQAKQRNLNDSPACMFCTCFSPPPFSFPVFLCTSQVWTKDCPHPQPPSSQFFQAKASLGFGADKLKTYQALINILFFFNPSTKSPMC